MEHAHTSIVVCPLLDSLLPDSWIGKHGPHNWPARSPGLSPPDFFLQGFVRDEVFRTLLCNATQFRRRITRAIRSIQQEMLQKWENLENRSHTIVREDGDHI